MSTGPTTVPENGPQGRGTRRSWLPRIRDAKIRSKLALILVVPVAAVIALASIRLVAIGQGAYDANLVHSLTAMSTSISALTQDLHEERMAAAAFLAEPGSEVDAYNLHIRRTDERIAAYHDERSRLGDVPAAVDDRLQVIDGHLVTLNGTRQAVLDRKQMPMAEAVLRYGVVITDLVAYSDVLGQIAGEGGIADSLRAAAAFARAKAATAEEEAVTYTALSSGRLEREQFASFVATLTSQQEALLAFTLAASLPQRALINATVSGDAVTLADRVSTEVIRSVGLTPLITADEAARSIGAVTDLMRWAEVRLESDLLAQADRARSDVVRQAIVESVGVLVTLVIAIMLAIMLARSLNRSLRQLREGALSVANQDLPEAVSRLRDVRTVGEGGVEEIVRQVRDPIRLANRDEVGQVAQAFNVVHREAVRIAAEQAALRTSVSAMFLNLARRSQALVDRMIGELDLIERGEEDPKRLAQLFELDHLATRMRRNDENLLVLAGADSSAPRREDALLVDALRAAQSEVELYNRIEFGTVDTDISIAANAVNDVVRLVAELLDNATRFSPPATAVVADARRIRDYVIIQVEDRGLGMTDEQLDSLNLRLAEPPDVDVAAFRLMGLAVVSRLSFRYGIRVELRRNVEGGTVAQVTLPSSIVVLPTPRRGQPLTRPRQPLAVEPGPVAAPVAMTWSAPAAPAARTPAAALIDQRRAAPPVQWETPPAPRGSGFPAPVTVQTTPTVAAAAAGPPITAHQLFPAATPTGGSSAGPVAGLGAALAATAVVFPPAVPPGTPRKEDVAEMPIFREMEAVWFRSHGQDETQIFTMPVVGHAPPPPAGASPPAPTAPAPTSPPVASPPVPEWASLPTRTPGQTAPTAPYSPSPGYRAAPVVTTPAPPTAVPSVPNAPQQRTGGEAAWRTAADEGWARANRAAEPADGGITRSGLPKRVPQAQLVPGGVAARSSTQGRRRTPDEVRGLLSAYHRGVQRGRTVGSEQYGTSIKETRG